MRYFVSSVVCSENLSGGAGQRPATRPVSSSPVKRTQRLEEATGPFLCGNLEPGVKTQRAAPGRPRRRFAPGHLWGGSRPPPLRRVEESAEHACCVTECQRRPLVFSQMPEKINVGGSYPPRKGVFTGLSGFICARATDVTSPISPGGLKDPRLSAETNSVASNNRRNVCRDNSE